MSKPNPRLFGTVAALLGLAAWIGLEARSARLLRERAGPLRAAAEKAGQVTADNALLRAKAARLSSERRDLADEIQALRLKQAALAKEPLEGFLPAGQWRNAGIASPESAYETFIWAIDRGDLEALAGVLEFTPEARAKLGAVFSNLPADTQASYGSAERMFALLYSNLNPVLFSATRTLPSEVAYGRFVALKTERQYAGGQVREHSFFATRFADGWKRAVSNGEVDYALMSQLGVEPEAGK